MRSFPERSPEDKRQEEPDDLALIQFLRQHRPPVPTAPPGLEDRIVAALDVPLTETPSRNSHRNTIPVRPVGAKHSVNICAESTDLLPNASPLHLRQVEGLFAGKARTGTDRTEWRSRRLRWLLPTTLVASLVAGVCSYQVLRTSPEPDPEVAKLEAFIDSTWSTPTDNPEAEVDFASQVLMEPTGATEP